MERITGFLWVARRVVLLVACCAAAALVLVLLRPPEAHAPGASDGGPVAAPFASPVGPGVSAQSLLFTRGGDRGLGDLSRIESVSTPVSSWPEAQTASDFTLLRPHDLPAGFSLRTIQVERLDVPWPDVPVAAVAAMYGAPGDDRPRVIVLDESRAGGSSECETYPGARPVSIPGADYGCSFQSGTGELPTVIWVSGEMRYHLYGEVDSVGALIDMAVSSDPVTGPG